MVKNGDCDDDAGVDDVVHDMFMMVLKFLKSVKTAIHLTAANQRISISSSSETLKL